MDATSDIQETHERVMNQQLASGGTLLGRLAALALAAAIFVGCLLLWIGIPLAWIWGASQLVTEYPAVYALAIVGCPATMVGWGWCLHRINTLYLRVSGAEPDAEPEGRRSAWLKSLSAERGKRRHPLSVLELSSIASVVIALLSIAIWFFFFAEMHLAPL